MAFTAISGEWFLLACGTKFIAAHLTEDREPFVFDCSTAKKSKDDSTVDGNSLESDRILAFTVSPSGKRVALTDDSKRLVLFQYEHSWQHVSTRWLVRRGTSLVFTKAEDEILVADKSGDVYSFSVKQRDKEGALKMGHLSMVLAVTMSINDKYIITADRDEKIRVSHLRSPYNIQSFCLGHKQFVSSLLVPSGDMHWLLSGSGDGTVKLWEYETGQKLESWDLNNLEETLVPKLDNEMKVTVCNITSSPDGCHIAVQCDRLSTIQFFMVNQDSEEKKLVPHSRISLPLCPLDITFDRQGRLWVLLDSCETLFQIYTLEHSIWKCDAASTELKRVTEAFKSHWQTLKVSTGTPSRFEHLHKATFDNVTVYMEKKQQRLEEQQQKRKMEQRDDGKKKKRVIVI
ncbi:tRNA (guanine-N(7)-)-methyltransferase non-catalytic subunit wdr4 isoform X3 [Corythoichthys intestinalis]|uniref:tRNA (guanine-N(7)-)-methyltransferase non-catalytic subunit wdr4 isoform X3 n=2 Tax=Corythoichthys intestinalis TaxID=161448 RepID=UPI0025A50B84|nr:tRNA (guanine-N(7)-)-methyltransferase non-catalytic subunit wdr4 isoform X3 [Corythoichthys intestinalis]